MEYIVGFKCKNCGTTNWLHIQKGVTVGEFLEDEEHICEKCEVKLSK